MIRFVKVQGDERPDEFAGRTRDPVQRYAPKNTGKTYPANGRRERIRRLSQAAAKRSAK